MLEESSLSPASAGPSAKLRMAGKKVQAIIAVSKNTIISQDTLFKLDAYALVRGAEPQKYQHVLQSCRRAIMKHVA